MVNMFPYSTELRSVTALCVVEDVIKCPLGYTPVRTIIDKQKRRLIFFTENEIN